jgi:hypothetical protein
MPMGTAFVITPGKPSVQWHGKVAAVWQGKPKGKIL